MGPLLPLHLLLLLRQRLLQGGLEPLETLLHLQGLLHLKPQVLRIHSAALAVLEMLLHNPLLRAALLDSLQALANPQPLQHHSGARLGPQALPSGLLQPQVVRLGPQHPQALVLGPQHPQLVLLGPQRHLAVLAALPKWGLLVSEQQQCLVQCLPLVLQLLAGEGSAALHSSHQPLVVPQAMPLERLHSREAMHLGLQPSSPVVSEQRSQTQALEEVMGGLGQLLAALPLHLLHSRVLRCGPCEDEEIAFALTLRNG